LIISLKPYDIQIFNLSKCESLEEFVSLYPKVEILHWCNGYLLMTHSIDEPTFSKELVNSNVYYFSEVWYIKHSDKDKPVKNTLNIPYHIADHTHNQMLNHIVKFIKTMESKK